MDLAMTDFINELAASTTAQECLDILARTPKGRGVEAGGFREEIERPIALRLPESDAWEARLGWPTGFVAGWIKGGHGAHFPIKQIMRNPSVPRHWILTRKTSGHGPGNYTARQRRALQYMLGFGICRGLTIPVRLPFGRTGCVTWFASDDDRHLAVDDPSTQLLQAAAEYFFEGIDRSRLWIAASPLSERETECLHWAARGMSDKEIARLIQRSVDTSSFHIKSAIRKLDAVNRTHAVALAVRAAFIEPTDPRQSFASSAPRDW